MTNLLAADDDDVSHTYSAAHASPHILTEIFERTLDRVKLIFVTCRLCFDHDNIFFVCNREEKE